MIEVTMIDKPYEGQWVILHGFCNNIMFVCSDRDSDKLEIVVNKKAFTKSQQAKILKIANEVIKDKKISLIKEMNILIDKLNINGLEELNRYADKLLSVQENDKLTRAMS